MAKEKKTTVYSTPYDLDGRLPLRQAIPLGLQHVLAMFVGNLTPLLSVMAICGITVQDYAALRISLLQNAMLVAGLVTLVQLFPIGPVGSRLPIVMGTSSGLGSHSTALQFMPDFISTLFGESGIVPAFLVAVILNLVLPKDVDQVEP